MLISVPTGVINLPFGRTAPLNPSIVTCRFAGILPAGAFKAVVFELRSFSSPAWRHWPATTSTATTDTITSGTVPALERNRRILTSSLKFNWNRYGDVVGNDRIVRR